MLDQLGYECSSGSACTSGALDPSHVLLALGLPHEIAHGSLRVTFGRSNTMDDVNRLIDDLEIVVRRLREMSPLYNENIFSVQTGPAAGQIVSESEIKYAIQ